MLRRQKLSDILTVEIRNQIASGSLAALEKLPSEQRLSDQFGVSRPIVRAALKQLRDDGYIISRRGSGSFVAAGVREIDDVSEHAASLPGAIQSIADVRRIFEFRYVLEGEVAWGAARRRTDAQLAEIERALGDLEAAISSGTVGSQQDSQFHAAVAAAAQNQFFETALAAVRPHLDFVINLARSLAIQHSEQHVRMVHQEHAAIARAIRDADPEAARAAMQTHIGNARQRMFEGIK